MADIEPRQQSYVIGPPIKAGGTVIGPLMEGANVSEQAGAPAGTERPIEISPGRIVLLYPDQEIKFVPVAPQWVPFTQEYEEEHWPRHDDEGLFLWTSNGRWVRQLIYEGQGQWCDRDGHNHTKWVRYFMSCPMPEPPRS